MRGVAQCRAAATIGVRETMRGALRASPSARQGVQFAQTTKKPSPIMNPILHSHTSASAPRVCIEPGLMAAFIESDH